ncbi:MAG: TetR/AcrR family transcriptional regulator [Bacteroidota bacterium]
MAGRKKIFNEEEVLEKAAKFFWENGFERSNARSLAEAIGMHPGSIYHSFNSKKGLFKRAFEHYGDRVERFIEHTIEAETNIKDGIRKLFYSLIEPNPLTGQGCFLGNTIVELSEKDKEIKKLATQILEKRVRQMENLILRGQERGEIDQEKDPKMLAGMLMNLWHGVNISKRLNQDKEALKQLINYSLAVLD